MRLPLDVWNNILQFCDIDSRMALKVYLPLKISAGLQQLLERVFTPSFHVRRITSRLFSAVVIHLRQSCKTMFMFIKDDCTVVTVNDYHTMPVVLCTELVVHRA